MPTKCPKCESTQLSKDNPFGLLVCPDCFWTSSEIHESKKGAYIRSGFQWLSFVSLISFFIFLCIQFYQWKEYSFESTVILGKEIVGVAGEKDYLDKGAICNSLDRLNCSIESFKKVLEQNPSQKAALANLSIVYAKAQNWKEAQKYFRSYFSLGGMGYDVMYWYAQTFMAIGDKEKGIGWYYRALSVNPEYQLAAEEIVAHLIQLQRPFEALSIIGSVTNGHPKDNWRSKLNAIDNYLRNQSPLVRNIAKESKKKEVEINLATFNRGDFYLPVRLGSSGDSSQRSSGKTLFFKVSATSKRTLINRELLSAEQLKGLDRRKVFSFKSSQGPGVAYNVTLPGLMIGPWKFDNINVGACNKCELILGQDLVSQMNLKYWTQNRIRFLTVALASVQK